MLEETLYIKEGDCIELLNGAVVEVLTDGCTNLLSTDMWEGKLICDVSFSTLRNPITKNTYTGVVTDGVIWFTGDKFQCPDAERVPDFPWHVNVEATKIRLGLVEPLNVGASNSPDWDSILFA